MADQIYNMNCGFFNAVNDDRVYYADDMNKPYKRVIANGVFATPLGTPSTDFQVVSASGAMDITIKAGDGMFGNKWFENPTDFTLTVSSNPNSDPRIDSIIAQVNNDSESRSGNIIYRTGEPAVSPAAPALVNNGTVYEYRIANIRIAPNASTITQSNITDLRGSGECPWVTSLIQQVDTSTLFAQWQAAYNVQYQEATQTLNDFLSDTQANWNAFIQTLTDDLNVTTNVLTLSNTYTTDASTSTIPIGIPSYNYLTDVLEVYINGLRATDYSLNSAHTSIVLSSALASGQTIDFIVLKSVIIGDAQTVLDAVQDLNDKIDAYLNDTGWINLTLENSTSAFDGNSTPQMRKNGDHIYLRGCIAGVASNNLTIATLPTLYRPSQMLIFPCVALNGNDVAWSGALSVDTSGYVKILGVSISIASYKVSITCSYQVDNLLS